MKRILSATICTMIVTAGAFFGGSAFAAEKTLRFADIQPLTHPLSIEGAQYFIKRVNAEGKGLISINHFPNRQLGKPKEMLDLLSRGGVMDIAFIGPTWYPGKMPTSTVGDLPGLYTDWQAGSRALWRLLTETELLEGEFTRWGIRPLVAVLIPSYDLVMKEPVADFMKLGGRKIRSPGGSYETAAKALGGTPVSMPSTQTYTALQRGTIDGTFANYLVVAGYKLNELLGYGTYGAPLGSFTFIYAVNEKVWQSLSPEQRDLLDRIGKETNTHMNKVLEQLNRSKAEKFAKENGLKLKVLTEDEKKATASLLKPVQDQWVETLAAKGHKSADTLATFKRFLAEEMTH